MRLSAGWVHLLSRARLSAARAASIAMALLLVTRGLDAQPLAGRSAEVSHLRVTSALRRLVLDLDMGRSGAKACKRAHMIAAKPGTSLRLYLDPALAGRAHRFSRARPHDESAIVQEIGPHWGSQARGQAPNGAAPDMSSDVWNAIEFMSEPLTQGALFSGAFSGRLDVISNRKDFDFSVMLFEVTPAGVYLPLSSYWARASALGDPSRPRPLTPGMRQQLAFRSERLMTRRVERGSRVVLVLGIIKSAAPQPQGSGRSGKASAAPLTIQWFDDSYIELQVSGGAEEAPGLPLPRSNVRAAGVKIAET